MTTDGFFFSTSAYAGAHEARGIVIVKSLAGATYKEVEPGMHFKAWIADSLSLSDVLSLAKSAAYALGADGLMNVEIRAAPRFAGSTRSVSGAELPGWEITGLAILRAP
ncbi:MAG: hypothetical protein WD771_08770 [Gemmatimonadaceae bacterium]